MNKPPFNYSNKTWYNYFGDLLCILKKISLCF